MKLKHFIYIILLVYTLLSFTNYSKYEIKEDTHLFKIDRSRDADAILYNININNGVLNTNNPIKPLWVRNSEHGQVEPLTWIQNKYAYGIKLLDTNSERTKFCFVSYPKRVFTLKKEDDNYKVYTISNNKEIELIRIFIQFNGGTFWIPIITKVELHGVSTKGKTATIEIIKP